MDFFTAAAYGGQGWSPRGTTLDQELGSIWRSCGVDNEWAPLREVLLHCPGAELEQVADPDQVQMMAPLDVARAQGQHGDLAAAYEDAGVTVHRVAPPGPALSPPNLMFVADLMFMTPEGVILGRPASTVRAGEERLIARRLAELGIPILRTVRGGGTFEGADAAWVDPQTVIVARGLRTNAEGVAQVTSSLREMGIDTITVDLPYGAMHLMGVLRFADRDLVVAWPGRVPYAAVEALRARGFSVLFLPDEDEAKVGMALNFVALGPRRLLIASGNDVTESFYQAAGIDCTTVEVDELAKAAGGIGCLTGVLHRESVDEAGARR